MLDRASRHLWLADFPGDHSAEATLAALIELFERIPLHLRLTLTWDQDPETASHALLADDVGIDIYFAAPHSPWQRPTNENGNGLIRRYVGKGTNLHAYTPQSAASNTASTPSPAAASTGQPPTTSTLPLSR